MYILVCIYIYPFCIFICMYIHAALYYIILYPAMIKSCQFHICQTSSTIFGQGKVQGCRVKTSESSDSESLVLHFRWPILNWLASPSKARSCFNGFFHQVTKQFASPITWPFSFSPPSPTAQHVDHDVRKRHLTAWIGWLVLIYPWIKASLLMVSDGFKP